MNAFGLRAVTGCRDVAINLEEARIGGRGRGKVFDLLARHFLMNIANHGHHRVIDIHLAAFGLKTAIGDLDLGPLAGRVVIKRALLHGLNGFANLFKFHTWIKPDTDIRRAHRRHGGRPFAAFNLAEIEVHRMDMRTKCCVTMGRMVPDFLDFLKGFKETKGRFNRVAARRSIQNMCRTA